jgi:protein phosphatase
MCYFKPYLIVFGGNLGNKVTNDVWIINIDDGILEWTKLDTDGESPCARMYHATAVCRHGGAAGMIIIYGGRSDGQIALNDTWGLRRHRNKKWDWAKAPYTSGYTPVKRFQVNLFINNLYKL